MNLESFLSESLQTDLSRIKQAVQLHLDKAPRSYIDHSTGHSQRIIEILKSLLTKLMQRQPTDNLTDLQPINENEMFVLLAAVYLHHIGILQISESSVPPTMYELNSHDLILSSVRDPRCNFNFGVPEQYVDEIAVVVQGLAITDISSTTYTSNFIGINTNLRVRLLSALLKLADGLDLTYQSIDFEKLVNSDADLATKTHWAKYHYVQGLGISQGKIEIHFRFPPASFDQYQRIIPELVFEDIEKVCDGLTDILWNYEIYVNLPTNLKNHKCLKRSIAELPADIKQVLKRLAEGKPVIELGQVPGGRTPSAIRNVGTSSVKYDVVISYASVHRDYAAQLARKLESEGLRVFFDRNQFAALTAQNLLDKLHEIYRDEANMCILMASEPYNRSPFTQHECQAAQNRSLRDPDYIFLVKMDGVSETQGFPSTVAYVEWKNHGLDGIFKLVIERLKKFHILPDQIQESVTTGRITVLLLVADPTDASRLRLGEELREIQEKLQLAKFRERFEIHQRMSIRPTDISQALLDIQPHIVHFSGHGMATGALCFENQIGETHPIQPDALAALFEQFTNQVNCVLLNACYSEVQANAISRHISHVIGMNRAVGDKAAIAFSVGFYQALGAGRTIEEAYKLGCVQIRLQDIPEHLTPVLIKKGATQP
jgi:hypothetical protein